MELAKRFAAAFLTAAALSATASAQDVSPELSAAFVALRSGDCVKLGSLVNDSLDSSSAIKLVAGLMHEEGLCLDRSAERAQRYYQSAESSKDWKSAMRIGLAYALGDGIGRSYSKAGAWFEKSFVWQGRPSISQKLVLAPVSGGEVTPLTEWNGYLTSVYFVGGNSVKYTSKARSLGAEGEYRVNVCLARGGVTATPERIGPSASAGVALQAGRHELISSIEDSYRRAISALPPPSMPAPHEACFANTITFRLGNR